MRRILIAGATSGVARAIADELAAGGDRLVLAARNVDELTAICADLQIRHQAEVQHLRFDARDTAACESLVAEAAQNLGGLDGVVLAVGDLGRQPQDSLDPQAAANLVSVNLTGPVSILASAANLLETGQSGFLLALTSVAGDRGRSSNYGYGAAKGGLSIFLEGLGHRLASAGVRVLDIKLGFVDTEMTYGLPGLFLVASPQSVGRRIAELSRHSEGVHYLPRFWRMIMFIIRNLPNTIMRRSGL